MPVSIESRAWFKPGTGESQLLWCRAHCVVMTIIGPCSPRWWWRGVGSAAPWRRCSPPPSPGEPSPPLPLPYGLGIIAMLLCLLFSVAVMGVPWRLPAAALLVTSLSAAPSDSGCFSPP